jgi:hypothetical protein
MYLRYVTQRYVYHGTRAHLSAVLHKSLPSVCVSMCVPVLVSRQRLGKHVPAVKNIRNNKGIVGRVVFYLVRVLSRESLWVCLCIPALLLGNSSVNTVPRQRRIVGGVVFYAVLVISKESRWLVLPTTSCFMYIYIYELKSFPLTRYNPWWWFFVTETCRGFNNVSIQGNKLYVLRW